MFSIKTIFVHDYNSEEFRVVYLLNNNEIPIY